MEPSQPTAKEASLLMGATMAVSMIGLFIAIFFLFGNTDLAIRIAAAMLVGIVGIISFLRHSVYYRSDQARMGWQQEHKEFQLEVGYANLAIGIWALVAAALNWGPLACGLTLAIYGTYLLCTLLLHISAARETGSGIDPAYRSRVIRSILSTGWFVVVLFAFTGIALARSGLAPSLPF
jgi:hypothetical protein